MALACSLSSKAGAEPLQGEKFDGWFFFSGQNFYDLCRSKESANQTACAAYVCGAVDAWAAAQVTTGKQSYKLCLPTRPGAVTCRQLSDSVTKYLEAHPDDRQSTAGGAVGYALQQTFPCKN
jgi:hypothetical protein